MKAINKYFLIALAGVSLTLTACSDDIEREPSPVPTDGIQAYVYADDRRGCYGASFYGCSWS